MPILVARIDDRLIHGLVTTNWVRAHQIQVIVIVDDDLVGDQVQLSVLKMAAPANVKVFVVSCDKFIEVYRAKTLEKYRVMLIFTKPFAPLKLIKNGVQIDSLNVGGMRYTEGRKQYLNAVSASEDEKEALKEMIGLGVEVEHRKLQGDKKVYLKDIF